MDIDSKSPEQTGRSLDDVIADMEAMLNPEIFKNYDTIMNWLLGINTIALFFILTNYDKVIVPENVALSINPNIFLVIGIVLLMFSMVVILFLRLLTFYFIHNTLQVPRQKILLLGLPSMEPTYKNAEDLNNGRDISVLISELDSINKKLKNSHNLTQHIFLANYSSFLGLIAIFIHFLMNISIFAIGFFGSLCTVFVLYLIFWVKKYSI